MFDTDVYLVGASGGVYALLAAHLANVLLVITQNNRQLSSFNSYLIGLDVNYNVLLFFFGPVELQQHGVRHRATDWHLRRR